MNKHKLSLEIFEQLKKMYEFAETAQYKAEFSKEDIDFISLMLDKLNQKTNQYKFLISPEFQQFIAEFKSENARSFNKQTEVEKTVEIEPTKISIETPKSIEPILQTEKEPEILTVQPSQAEIENNETIEQDDENFNNIEEQLNILEHDEEMLELEKLVDESETVHMVTIQPEFVQIESVDSDVPEMAKIPDINTRMSENQANSINDINAGKPKNESLSTKLQKQALTDLSKAIGLNERFMFTKSLFKSDVMAYGQAISKLNSIESLEDAESYLTSDLAKKFNWNEESKEVVMFFDLIKSRYQ